MSSFRRETDLLDSGGWSRWEMNSLAPTTAETRAAQSGASQKNSASTGNTLKPVQTDYERGFSKGQEEALKQATAEGHKAGYAKGYEEGAAAAQAKMQTLLAKKAEEALQPVKEMARNFSASLDTISEEVSLHLVELASAIGRQLAMDALIEQPELINTLVRTMIEQDFSPASRPQLLLNPKDLPLIEAQLNQELATLGWQIKADEKITRGGCQLRSNLDQIDATWETRCRSLLSRIRRRELPSAGEPEAEA